MERKRSKSIKDLEGAYAKILCCFTSLKKKVLWRIRQTNSNPTKVVGKTIPALVFMVDFANRVFFILLNTNFSTLLLGNFFFLIYSFNFINRKNLFELIVLQTSWL